MKRDKRQRLDWMPDSTSDRDFLVGSEQNRLRRIGILAALIGLVTDQASKLWLLFGYAIEQNQPIRVTPFFDIIAVWNYGISYGLFQQNSVLGQWVLLAVTGIALIFLCLWLWRAENRLSALSLGLIIGGAIGNGIDRMAYGAVFDFASFHFQSFSWYIFNAADVWIVAGVIGLLYDGFVSRPEKATNHE